MVFLPLYFNASSTKTSTDPLPAPPLSSKSPPNIAPPPIIPFRRQKHIRPLIKEQRYLLQGIKREPQLRRDIAPIIWDQLQAFGGDEKSRKDVGEEGEEGQRQVRRFEGENQQRPNRHSRVGGGGGGGGGGGRGRLCFASSMVNSEFRWTKVACVFFE